MKHALVALVAAAAAFPALAAPPLPDLIRIRRNVALRYDPLTRQLVVHVDP